MLHFFLEMIVRIDSDVRVISPVLIYQVLFYLLLSKKKSVVLSTNLCSGWYECRMCFLCKFHSKGNTSLCLSFSRKLCGEVDSRRFVSLVIRETNLFLILSILVCSLLLMMLGFDYYIVIINLDMSPHVD